MRAPVSTLQRVLILLLAIAVAACGRSEREAESGPVVLAAASLQEALTEVAAAWTRAGHPAPVLSFAATSALARQIERGAPADLFVAADEEWVDTLDQAKRLRPGSRRDLLTNDLVLIRAPGSAISRLAELGLEKLALADPQSVPAGKYARAALESTGQWLAVERNVVPAENVRGALALVERQEAALGIVYATDAKASHRVEVIDTFPAASYPPIHYPVVTLAGSRNGDTDSFSRFLSSPEASAIFRKHGFGIAR